MNQPMPVAGSVERTLVGEVVVSTIRLGSDDKGPRFETMVLAPTNEWGPFVTPSEALARRFHRRVVDALSDAEDGRALQDALSWLNDRDD